jgi:Amt family ammonium transporter
MKRLFALLALVGAVAFGAPAWAEEKGPPEAAVAAGCRNAGAAAAAAAEGCPGCSPGAGPEQGRQRLGDDECARWSS